MRATRFIGAAISVLAAVCAVTATLGQEVHYSPEEDLARIDANLISEAKDLDRLRLLRAD